MNTDMNNNLITLDKSEWRIGELFKSGGFGCVYRAVSTDGEHVVAKMVPKSPGADREMLFVNLAGSTNVVPILDCGEWNDQWILIMPKAEKSLSDHIKKKSGRFEVEEAVMILRNVVEALVELEDRVVHRDIKPSNILLLNDTWCLADFGISRYAEATTGSDTRKYAMTPPYAAPEQWRNEHATEAADVYAMGVVAYELLNGKRPFQGPHVEDFRQQHLSATPLPLVGIPENLGSLIIECLYKSAESRPKPSNILERLRNVTQPDSEAARRLQQINTVVVNRHSELRRQESIAKSEALRRAELSEVGKVSLDRILDMLCKVIVSNAPNVESSSHTWKLDHARLSVESSENTGPLRRSPSNGLPFDVVSYSKITVDRPSDRFGYEGRSHSLWYCDAQEAGVFRWFELAFMYCPLRRMSSLHDPFALDPDENASEALSTVSGTMFQAAWPFTPIDQGNESDFIEQWLGWFADAASGKLQKPNRMPEKDPKGSWRRN